MKPETKQSWLDVAAILGRFMPKIIVMFYYVFFAKAWYYVVEWFMGFDWTTVQDPTVALAIAGFPAAILAVLTAVLKTLTEIAFKAMNGEAKDR